MSPKDRVYQFLSEKISTGELTHNDKITETYLADHLDMSRTPIREALIQLDAEGIIAKSANKGYTLKKLTLEEVNQLYQCIGILDAYAATLALPRLSPADKNELHYLVDVMDVAIKNGMYTRYNELQMAFHNFYTQKCGNHILINELARLKNSFVGKSYSLSNPAQIEKVLFNTNAEHKFILELFEKGDIQALQNYIQQTHWSKVHAKYDLF